MSLGDIYELTHDQRLLGQQVINRYHFENTDIAGDAEDLAEAFNLDVLPFVQAAQHQDVTYVRLVIVNYDDPTDFVEFDLTGQGGGRTTSPVMPSHICGQLVLRRSSREIRNGFKRYAGVTEADVTANSLTQAYQDLLSDIATALINPIDNIAGAIFRLRLYGGVTQNRAAPIVVPIASISVDATVTTQNSRKPGYGR